MTSSPLKSEVKRILLAIRSGVIAIFQHGAHPSRWGHAEANY
jgi:hypothetical protein